ncbi:MAG: hypothetical protein QOI59_2151 [Gammaproteobacteria bacterium]|jgi:hypothetical protein|nr:hypothetical protein [Gammaproteobacteria bacterium]
MMPVCESHADEPYFQRRLRERMDELRSKIERARAYLRQKLKEFGAVSYKPDNLTFDHAVQMCGGAFDIRMLVLASSALRG